MLENCQAIYHFSNIYIHIMNQKPYSKANQQINRLQSNYTNSYSKQGWPLFKINPHFSKMPNRSIYSNIVDTQVCDNSIKTSKYTFYNFVPKNLIVQFSKVANIYFLIIGIMQMIPSISVSGGFPVIFMPLSIVVGTSAIKDYYQDRKRKTSDIEINSKSSHTINTNPQPLIIQQKWQSLRIGQIIRVKKNQQFPADVILLASSQSNQDCFIQTKNLDGQTNLKFKKIIPQISNIYLQATPQHNQKNKSYLHTIFRQFKYERPNPYIHTFNGSFEGKVPLNNNNIALRGCSLKMTQWVYGLVIYTGVDTKIMLNSNKTRQKKSRLQFRMGIIVAVIFIIQMGLTFLCALLGVISSRYTLFIEQWFPQQDIIDIDENIQAIEKVGNRLLINWGAWILLFTNFVPISLIVSLQMVKYIQGIRISVKQQNKEIIVQTSTLNEQLGQIQHLFSDKTGTLTKNYMSFKYMIAGHKTYGYGTKNSIPDHITNVQFHDKELIDYLNTEKISSSHQQHLYDIFLAFSICHNVILEKNQNSQDNNIKYNASSPDQLAFINMARFAGWQFLGIDSENFIKIKYKDSTLKYKLLNIFQFNSDRKRMTIIVEKLPTHSNQGSRIFVFTKGADNVIFERLRQENHKKIQTVKKRLQQWSVQGLRTLVFSKRQIKKEDYDKWAKMYAFSLANLQKKAVLEKSAIRQMAEQQSAKKREKGQNFSFNLNSISRLIIQQNLKQSPKGEQSPFLLINNLLTNHQLTQSQKRFLDEHLMQLDKGEDILSSKLPSTQQLEKVIEKQLELIGATAIEDKLQDNAKQVIQKLRKAKVKVWMLTGDKKETAINIGVSCGIIADNMAILNWKNNLQQTIKQRQNYKSRDCCLVVSGSELLSIETQQINLIKLVNSCQAIVCCRVTPKQKQDMVWLMRKNRFTTMAIGDGANDVNMINTAHVGIGIKGVQGAQAALCSDYAISQFQIVGQLMLYHGRQCYRKNSQLIMFNFYKNLLLVLPQLWYGFNNGFSPCNIYDPWIYQLYNVAFTSLPIMVYAILDQRYSLKYSLLKPQLYRKGVENKLFNLKKVINELLYPVIFSFFITTITFIGMERNGLSGGSWSWDQMTSGMTIFVSCVIICNFKILILSCKLSKLLLLTASTSIFLYFISYQIAQKIFWMSRIANTMHIFLNSLDFYLIIFTNVALVCIIEYTLQIYINNQIVSHSANQNPKQSQEFQMKLLDKNQ